MTIQNRKNKIFAGFTLSFLFFSLCLAFFVPEVLAQTPAQTPGAAQGEYQLLAPIPCIQTYNTVSSDGSNVDCPGGVTGNVDHVDFHTYIQYFMNLFIALAAVGAVFMIVWGGFEYMTTTAIQGKTDGRERIKNALYELVLVLCSYIILRTIDPRLVAIPTTLVPQLELSCPSQPGLKLGDPGCKASNQTQSFFDRLIQEAAQNQQEAQDAITIAQQAKKNAAQLQQENADLQTKISVLQEQNVPSDDPQIQEMKRQIQINDDLIQKSEVDAVVNLAKSVMKNGDIAQTANELNGKTTRADIYAAIDSGIAAVEKTRQVRDNELKSINYPDTSAIDTQAKYSNVILALMKNDALVNATDVRRLLGGNGVVAGIPGEREIPAYMVKKQFTQGLYDVESSISFINDPTLKQDLLSRLQTSRDALNAKFNK